MKLWLDDIRHIPYGYDFHAKTAQAAIALLQSEYITEISLDHDLGPEEAGTGYDVACFIEEGAYNGTIKPMKMHIHSANPVGCENMKKALLSACRYWGVDPNEWLCV